MYEMRKRSRFLGLSWENYSGQIEVMSVQRTVRQNMDEESVDLIGEAPACGGRFETKQGTAATKKSN